MSDAVLGPEKKGSYWWIRRAKRGCTSEGRRRRGAACPYKATDSTGEKGGLRREIRPLLFYNADKGGKKASMLRIRNHRQ